MLQENVCKGDILRTTVKIIFFLYILIFITAAAPQGSDSKIAPLVLASEKTDEKIPVIIVLKEQPGQSIQSGKTTGAEALNDVKSRAAAGREKVLSSLDLEAALDNADDINNYYLVNAISVKASASAISRLASFDEVERIEPDVKVMALPVKDRAIKRSNRPYPDETAWGINWIEAPLLWERGINGSKVNVSIIDTGIAPHPDIADRIIAFRDFVRYLPYNGTRVFYSGRGSGITSIMERNFTLGSNPGLEFAGKYDLDYIRDHTAQQITYLDFGYVNISSDGGASWKNLRTLRGISDGYMKETIDLSAYNGTNVTVRFTLITSDQSSRGNGWHLDDIRIKDGSDTKFFDGAESGMDWDGSGWTITSDSNWPSAPYDDSGHGTHVAGTVAGSGKMGINTGVAPGASLLGAKVLDSTGSGYSSDVIRGIEWSYENNADVISLSLGTLPVDSRWNSDFNIVNPGATAVENITVFSNPFAGSPTRTATPGAFQPTSIFGGVIAYTENSWWEMDASWETYLQIPVNLTGSGSATLNFSTNYTIEGSGYVQVSTDGEDWIDLSSFSGGSLEGERYWKNVSIDLSPYAGGNVTIRFYHPYSGEYDFWQIDNISIPETGFFDDAGAGSQGWEAGGWNIVSVFEPVDIHILNISLNQPDGNAVKGDAGNWGFGSDELPHSWGFESGELPANAWLYKYTGVPLQAGMWNLTITSGSSRPVYYYYLLLAVYPGDGSDAVSQALDKVADKGVVPVVAAGNDGYLGLYSISAPGASGKAITAGATEYGKDHIAAFSSRGPVGLDKSIKPDIAAPGVDITSLDTGNSYVNMSGTSMAAPHVSGAVALMLQRNRSLSPAQVKKILMDSSIDLGEPGKDNTYGAGRISAYAAVVNASTQPLPPIIRPVPDYELFAGSAVDNILLRPFILDAEGDVPESSIDIRSVNIYNSGYGSIQFKIFTASSPDLNNSEFIVYLDTDKNAGTGFLINDIGADYEIRINSTASYLYRINGSYPDFIATLSTHVSRTYGDEGVDVALSQGSINQTTAGFFGVVQNKKGESTDTAPDSGHGVFPYAGIPIKLVGISWNATGGAPRAGINLTFVVQRSDYSQGDNILANITRTTDSKGMAGVEVTVNQTRTWERYDTYVSDDAENMIYDPVYVNVETPSRKKPFMVPGRKDYYAVQNATLPVKITLLTPEWQPYNHNVTLKIGNSRNYVAAELTPSSGTIEYELNLSRTTFNDCGQCSIQMKVLNGSLTGSDFELEIGDVNIRDDSSTFLKINPQSRTALPGGKPDFLIESYGIMHENNHPVSRKLAGFARWIREVDVRALGEELQPSIPGKLDMMRTYALSKGKADNLLTRQEREELNRALLGPENIWIDYTQFDLRTDSTGIALFNITVPDDNVYYGIIGVSDPEDEQSYDQAFVFVRDNNSKQHFTASSPSHELNVSLNWNASKIGSRWIADDNFTVSLDLMEINSSSGNVRHLPGETVFLYSNTGEAKAATTDENGKAGVNFTAPEVDITNSSCEQLCHSGHVQVWGITGFTTQDRIAVAREGLGFIRAREGHNYTLMDTDIVNNNLDITVRYMNDGNNIPSIVDAFQATDPLSQHQGSRADLISGYVNEDVYHSQIPLSGFGTYSARSFIEYSSPVWKSDGLSSTSRVSQTTFTPFNISTYISPGYPVNIVQPVTVSVLDLNRTPVHGASVYLIEENGEGSGGYIDVNKTDPDGNAVLMLRTPDAADAWISYRIGGATEDIAFPYIKQGSFRTRAAGNKPDLEPVVQMSGVIEAGKEINITGIVYNSGDAPSVPSIMGIYVNDILLANMSIGAIQNGGYARFAQAWMPGNISTYEITAVVDAAGMNDELDETNNIDVITVTASLPDLTPEIIMSSSVQNGSDADIVINVRNTGGIAAPASSLLMLINHIGFNTFAIPSILPGGMYTVRAGWIPLNVGNYTITAISDPAGAVHELDESDNESVKNVEVSVLPDLIVSLTAPSEMRVNTTVNLSVRVVNHGSASSNETILGMYEGAALLANITVPSLNGGETMDYEVQYTPLTTGTKLIRAIIDPGDTTRESGEHNNIAAKWIIAGERDVRVFISTVNKAISGTSEKAWIYVARYGNLRTHPTNLTVNVSDDQSYVLRIPAFSLNGETNVTVITVPIRGNTTISAFAAPVDETNITNNYAAKVIEGVDLNLSINRVLKPSWQVWANTSFWTGARFSSSAETVVNATIQLQDGLRLLASERKTKKVYAEAGDSNYVDWDVIAPDDFGTYYYNITISTNDVNDTESISVSTVMPLATLKDFNSTLISNRENRTMTFASFNAVSLRSGYNLTIVGGSEGRVLDGLEYLFDYPHGCVEQTSSPVLAGLNVKKYYETAGLWNNKSASTKAEMIVKIRSGLERLQTMQAPSGAFAVWGGEYGDDALPTIYAYYAISRALYDSDASTSGIEMKPDRIASWVAAHQEEDGSWLSKYRYGSYYTKPVLTGMALMDYNLSYPFLNSQVAVHVNDSRDRGVQYLLDSQRPDGSWNHSVSQTGDPYVTGFALLGLAYSGNQSAAVVEAMNRSKAWLLASQRDSGSWQGTAVYKAWSDGGIMSETTAVVMQALLAAGVPENDPAIERAANYLIGVYESDKSWGYTKTTQEAIQALLKVMKIESIDLNLTVSINGNISVYHINSTNRTIADITGGVTCVNGRVCDNIAEISAGGTGSAVVSIGGTQVIRYREKQLFPKIYVDPIDEDLSLNISVASGIEREPVAVNLSVSNPTDESIFSPVISIPLDSAALYGGVTDKTGANVANATINNTLYIYPVMARNRTTESYLFNLIFNNSGYQTIAAEFAPMYNPTLLTPGNGTGYIKGRGSLSFTVYEGYGAAIDPSINLSGASGSDLSFTDLVEGSYDVNISGAGYIDVISHVNVSSGVLRQYIVRMFGTLSQPEVVLSEYDARPAFFRKSTDASTGMIDYEMTVSAKSNGTATVAMTIPENLDLLLSEVDAMAVSPEMFNNTAYFTTDMGNGSVVRLLFRPSENTTVSCLLDSGRTCSSNTSESEIEIHSSDASSGDVSTNIASNASVFGADGLTPGMINTTGLDRYLNITYSNLMFDWAIIRIFYYTDEITNKNIDEGSLRIYWYDYGNSSWHSLDSDSDYSSAGGPRVYSAGVNKAAGRGYAWANLTHFSTFSIAGSRATAKRTPAPTPLPGGDSPDTDSGRTDTVTTSGITADPTGTADTLTTPGTTAVPGPENTAVPAITTSPATTASPVTTAPTTTAVPAITGSPATTPGPVTTTVPATTTSPATTTIPVSTPAIPAGTPVIPANTPARSPGRPGSGGGGGSGVITSEPYENIAGYETISRDHLANLPETHVFKTSELGVYEILCMLKESEMDMTLRVEALKGPTRLVTVAAPGVVYMNINIMTNTKKLKTAVIRFRVENSWIGSNDLAGGDVKMLKWDGSKWMQLDTSEKTRDAKYTYYEAKTDSFSHFAISGVKGEAGKTGAPQATRPGISPAVTGAQDVTEAPTGKAPPVNLWIIIEVIVLIAIVAAVYLRRK